MVKCSAISRFLRDESGATAIEYALMTAGVAGAIIGVVTTTGENLLALWTKVKNAFG